MDYNAKYWKSKSSAKSAENKELNKRLKEVKAGRENWKMKYKAAKQEAVEYKKELDSIKKKIEKILGK